VDWTLPPCHRASLVGGPSKRRRRPPTSAGPTPAGGFRSAHEHSITACRCKHTVSLPSLTLFSALPSCILVPRAAPPGTCRRSDGHDALPRARRPDPERTGWRAKARESRLQDDATAVRTVQKQFPQQDAPRGSRGRGAPACWLRAAAPARPPPAQVRPPARRADRAAVDGPERHGRRAAAQEHEQSCRRPHRARPPLTKMCPAVG